ncbi:hypothetical protein HPT29_004555 [Microvirga terrae]|uniref:Calcium-binding protein n=1 Tax=Microvirga terrae TaxID=2740529 RepID=A0ABY5RT42_9HYPH|nr:hypothetical protein [Microvirga terrae]UVF20426.1 hypothetical protein HPT29_004555 [Microvirga terrae]
MNKPVFENVIGDRIDVGNVLDDTLAGGAAAYMAAPDMAPPLDDHPSRAPGLALPQDEKDGRRSMEAPATLKEDDKAAHAIERLTPLVKSEPVLEDRFSSDRLSNEAVQRNSSALANAINHQEHGAGGTAAKAAETSHAKGKAATLSDQPSFLASDKSADSAGPVMTFSSIYLQGKDDPNDPDSIDLRGIAFSVRADLLAGNDTIWAGGAGDASIDGGAGNDMIYGRFFSNIDDGQYGDNYSGGTGIDTVDFSLWGSEKTPVA